MHALSQTLTWRTDTTIAGAKAQIKAEVELLYTGRCRLHGAMVQIPAYYLVSKLCYEVSPRYF